MLKQEVHLNFYMGAGNKKKEIRDGEGEGQTEMETILMKN